jgi:hypothetical protein
VPRDAAEDARMLFCTMLYALRPGVALGQVRTARESLQSLVETLPGVEHFVVTHNVASDSHGFNLVLFAAFTDRTACDIFLRHPEFARVHQEELAPVVERKIVAVGED